MTNHSISISQAICTKYIAKKVRNYKLLPFQRCTFFHPTMIDVKTENRSGIGPQKESTPKKLAVCV